MSFKNVSITAGVMVGVAVVWWLVAAIGFVDQFFLPSPITVYKSFISLSKSGLWVHVFATSVRVFGAVAFSFLIALPLSLAMYWIPALRKVTSPLIDFIRYLPIPALVPLFILFFGIDEGVKIVILFTGTFFQVILLIVDFLKSIPHEYYELAYVFHFSKTKTLHMQVRSILPQLWDVLRVSIGWCWTYVIIAELVATNLGVGRVIKEAQRFSDSSKLYAVLFVIGFVGLMIDQGMKIFAPKMFPYLCTKETL